MGSEDSKSDSSSLILTLSTIMQNIFLIHYAMATNCLSKLPLCFDKHFQLYYTCLSLLSYTVNHMIYLTHHN